MKRQESIRFMVFDSFIFDVPSHEFQNAHISDGAMSVFIV